MDIHKDPVRPRGTDCAEVIQVIKTVSLRGIGIDKDPARLVTEYWSLDGEKLAEADPIDSRQ